LCRALDIRFVASESKTDIGTSKDNGYNWNIVVILSFDQSIQDFAMPASHDVVIRKLRAHSNLDEADLAAIRRLPYTERQLSREEDIVRQGDKPKASAVVMQGMVARYHTLQTGKRQFLSLHIAGDMPDAQTLFIDSMDHAVCAIEDSVVSLVPHAALLTLFEQRPSIGFAIWRETLIDAAIFREAITNNSGRPLGTRLAHFLCEQYYRARAAGQAKTGSCKLPLTQTQIGEALGASLPSISRALQTVRRTRSMDLRGGTLYIHNWTRMVELGDFNPSYLHLRKPSRL
jgi:CRP-like cAMP-binding protein